MAHNARIEAAIADLHSQVKPNIAATAKKYEICWKGYAQAQRSLLLLP
jgi:hypothetical protein